MEKYAQPEENAELRPRPDIHREAEWMLFVKREPQVSEQNVEAE